LSGDRNKIGMAGTGGSFGARDLALLLPDEVGETIAFKPKGDDEDKLAKYQPLVPRVDTTKKTRRYFPGQVPTWIEAPEDEEVTIEIDAPKSTEPIVDRRLARIAQTQGATSSSSSGSGRSRRRIYEAEVIEESSSSSVSASGVAAEIAEGDILEGDNPFLQKLEEEHEENEEEIAARRQRVRDRLASRRHEVVTSEHSGRAVGGILSMADQKLLQATAQQEESSEYETDTDDTDSEEESGGPSKLLKPLFISRQYRETLRQQEEEEKIKEVKQQQELLFREERKHQTRVLLAESIKKQNDLDAMRDVTDNDSDAGLPDDLDYEDQEEEEYNAWKIREMFRIKRETELREEMIREAKDIERRRNMSDEERYQEDLKLGRFEEKEKKKWKFLQKYYHKGVFYMDDNSVQKNAIQSQYASAPLPSSSASATASSYYAPRPAGDDKGEAEKQKAIDARLRDYDEPTLEDKFNKESLPAIMQVKKFGMRGRTKYTHLVDQDTTEFLQPLRPDERVRSNYMAKRAGVGDISGKRKRPRGE
jgi:microfibrillar-associated protein 1